jgi:hypothetical protein
MKNETVQSETVQTAPRKLSKPVREQPELKREELVTYTNESGQTVPFTTPGPEIG